MRNIFMIGLIVLGMGYMVSILVDKYNAAIEQDKNKKELQVK